MRLLIIDNKKEINKHFAYRPFLYPYESNDEIIFASDLLEGDMKPSDSWRLKYLLNDSNMIPVYITILNDGDSLLIALNHIENEWQLLHPTNHQGNNLIKPIVIILDKQQRGVNGNLIDVNSNKRWNYDVLCNGGDEDIERSYYPHDCDYHDIDKAWTAIKLDSSITINEGWEGLPESIKKQFNNNITNVTNVLNKIISERSEGHQKEVEDYYTHVNKLFLDTLKELKSDIRTIFRFKPSAELNSIVRSVMGIERHKDNFCIIRYVPRNQDYKLLFLTGLIYELIKNNSSIIKKQYLSISFDINTDALNICMDIYLTALTNLQSQAAVGVDYDCDYYSVSNIHEKSKIFNYETSELKTGLFHASTDTVDWKNYVKSILSIKETADSDFNSQSQKCLLEVNTYKHVSQKVKIPYEKIQNTKSDYFKEYDAREEEYKRLISETEPAFDDNALLEIDKEYKKLIRHKPTLNFFIFSSITAILIFFTSMGFVSFRNNMPVKSIEQITVALCIVILVLAAALIPVIFLHKKLSHYITEAKDLLGAYGLAKNTFFTSNIVRQKMCKLELNVLSKNISSLQKIEKEHQDNMAIKTYHDQNIAQHIGNIGNLAQKLPGKDEKFILFADQKMEYLPPNNLPMYCPLSYLDNHRNFTIPLSYNGANDNLSSAHLFCLSNIVLISDTLNKYGEK